MIQYAKLSSRPSICWGLERKREMRFDACTQEINYRNRYTETCFMKRFIGSTSTVAIHASVQLTAKVRTISSVVLTSHAFDLPALAVECCGYSYSY